MLISQINDHKALGLFLGVTVLGLIGFVTLGPFGVVILGILGGLIGGFAGNKIKKKFNSKKKLY